MAHWYLVSVAVPGALLFFQYAMSSKSDFASLKQPHWQAAFEELAGSCMGVAHRHVKVRMLIDNTEVIVINRKTGEILKYFRIDPTTNYQIPASWPEMAND